MRDTPISRKRNCPFAKRQGNPASTEKCQLHPNAPLARSNATWEYFRDAPGSADLGLTGGTYMDVQDRQDGIFSYGTLNKTIIGGSFDVFNEQPTGPQNKVIPILSILYIHVNSPPQSQPDIVLYGN